MAAVHDEQDLVYDEPPALLPGAGEPYDPSDAPGAADGAPPCAELPARLPRHGGLRGQHPMRRPDRRGPVLRAPVAGTDQRRPRAADRGGAEPARRQRLQVRTRRHHRRGDRARARADARPSLGYRRGAPSGHHGPAGRHRDRSDGPPDRRDPATPARHPRRRPAPADPGRRAGRRLGRDRRRSRAAGARLRQSGLDALRPRPAGRRSRPDGPGRRPGADLLDRRRGAGHRPRQCGPAGPLRRAALAGRRHDDDRRRARHARQRERLGTSRPR